MKKKETKILAEILKKFLEQNAGKVPQPKEKVKTTLNDNWVYDNLADILLEHPGIARNLNDSIILLMKKYPELMDVIRENVFTPLLNIHLNLLKMMESNSVTPEQQPFVERLYINLLIFLLIIASKITMTQ